MVSDVARARRDVSIPNLAVDQARTEPEQRAKAKQGHVSCVARFFVLICELVTHANDTCERSECRHGSLLTSREWRVG